MFQLALLLQALLATMAFAAPVTTLDNAASYGTGGGILGFIVLVIDVLVFVEVIKSNRPPLHKVLWCLGVFFFPILGAIVYFFFSDRQKHSAGAGGYEPIV